MVGHVNAHECAAPGWREKFAEGSKSVWFLPRPVQLPNHAPPEELHHSVDGEGVLGCFSSLVDREPLLPCLGE